MGSDEPTNLAIVILVGGLLLGIAAITTRASRRGPVPLMLVFLVVGMLSGAEGIGGIRFDDYVLEYRIGTVALVLILFDGGLSTRLDRVRAHLPPSIVLATVGVVLTAGVLAIGARLLGLRWTEALLLASVVSSTDAAAVFSVLRGSGMNLQQRVSATIELESGMNDPMAIVLTTSMAGLALAGGVSPTALVWQIPVQLVVGTLVGLVMGRLAYLVLVRIPPTTAGLFPVVTVAVAFVAYGASTLLLGSDILAVYVSGLVLGSKTLPDRHGLRRVHDFLAWASQVMLFLTLGLLVNPSDLLDIALVGLACSAVLVLVARPIAVVLCLLPFRYPRREVAYISWVGLRGSVPVVLATYPVLVGVPDADRLFNLVFFLVVVSVIVQATTVRSATRVVGLEEPAPPPPEASIEIASMRPIESRVACYHIDTRAAVAGATLAEVPFPEEAAVMMIVRGEHLLPARGNVKFEPGDHVYVFCKPDDEDAIALWFGQRIDE